MLKWNPRGVFVAKASSVASPSDVLPTIRARPRHYRRMAVRDFPSHVLLAGLLYSTTACSGELQPARDDPFVGAGAGSAASGTGGTAASGVAGAAGQASSHAGRGGNGSIKDAGALSSTDGATTLADAGNTDANLLDAGADAAQAVPEGPIGPSEGCGHAPDDAAALQGFSKHDITVSGVDPDFISEHVPKSEIAPYTWTHRNYFLKLPANYDPQKPYPLHFGGSGCGNTDGMSGRGEGSRCCRTIRTAPSRWG